MRAYTTEQRKRQRKNNSCSAPPPPPTLPAELLLDIAARCDVGTVVRCAAACQTFRRTILTADFIQQLVSRVVPTRVLASLNVSRYKRRNDASCKTLITPVHPATPVATSFVDNHLAPFVSRRAADLLRTYGPVTSRGGLILLRRRRLLKRHRISPGTNMCVYDPLTDARTFLSEPPGICMDDNYFTTSCVLLTAADGIGWSSFALLVADMSIRTSNINDVRRSMRIQIATLSDANIMSWGSVTECVCRSGPFQDDSNAVVLPGGLVHWLPQHDRTILTYDVRTRILGTVACPSIPGRHHLAVSPEGKLRILVVDGFVISVWLQQSADGWAPEAVIDTEEKIRSIGRYIHSHVLGLLKLWCSGESGSNTVLLRIDWSGIIFDLETREMRAASIPLSVRGRPRRTTTGSEGFFITISPYFSPCTLA